MTPGENYIDKMIISAIDEMDTQEFVWPVNWSVPTKKKFLDDCLEWLEENQLYERCQIILDVKKKL
tara:strand:+ start:1102 stop:1299 length:198 start_codon:yes stop_codon:yes gene_type:complete